MAVGVAVAVVAPVIVAALGNGNATVGVIDAVSADATAGRSVENSTWMSCE